MTVEEVVAKGQHIIRLADEGEWDEYEVAVIERFGGYLSGGYTLEEVNQAFDEWLETLLE